MPLPAVPTDPLGWRGVPGKAIVYARRPLLMCGGDALVAADDVADVGADGTTVPAGAPICTVFARGATHEDGAVALARRGAAVVRQLEERSEAA